MVREATSATTRSPYPVASSASDAQKASKPSSSLVNTATKVMNSSALRTVVGLSLPLIGIGVVALAACLGSAHIISLQAAVGISIPAAFVGALGPVAIFHGVGSNDDDDDQDQALLLRRTDSDNTFSDPTANTGV